MNTDFRVELEQLLNSHSIDNMADTPDYILSDYVCDCLGAFIDARRRLLESGTDHIALNCKEQSK